MVKIRPYTLHDHKVIEPFFTERGWPEAPSEEVLPKTGLVAEDSDNGQILAVGFVYTTDSCVFLLEWTATNPEAPLKIRREGLRMVLETAKEVVKGRNPNGQIIQMMPNEKLVEFYKKQGFNHTETAHIVHWG